MVKGYSYYLIGLKKIGWHKLRKSYFKFIFNQKLVHLLVIVLTVLAIFVNLTSKTLADNHTDNIQKTILAELIESEFGELEEDEQLIIESFDKESTISTVQQSYLDNLSSFRPQPKVTIGEDGEEIETQPAITQEGSSIVRRDSATTRISKKPREKTISYTILPGDTISTIAEEFEISVSTILWENNLSAYSIIRPGKKLDILPVSGISHTVKKGENISYVAKKYKIDEAKIIETNKLGKSAKLAVNQKIIIPNGRKITPKYVPKTYTGIGAIKNLVKSPSAKPVLGNKMNWPTVGRRITQYYSWRHHGLDIANKTGTPLYAADSGTVEMVGWGRGYGNQVVIDHGGGKKTRYAHCSKFYVSRGEKVTKGQTIAAMGNTGWSTGPHIHFEVIINGRKYNPLNYIK